jgi:signal transduction histidine kinase/ligand-binding sensor domain-containing protein
VTGAPFSLPNNQIDEMLEDKAGNFWIASDDGLCLMTDFHDDLPEGQFEVYQNDVFIEQSLSTNAIKALYADKDGRLWIGSYFGGISVYDPDYFRFQTIRHHPLKTKSLPGNNVTAIKSDSNGNLLVGLDNDGLCLLPGGSANIGENLYEVIELRNSLTGELEKKIKSIEVDRHGFVWVGTWGGGLFRYNLQTKKYRHFRYGPSYELPSESVISLAADGDVMWIGTFNGGLVRYDVSQDTYRYYIYAQEDTTTLGSNKIFALLNDDAGNLWIGTESGGLNVLDKQQDKLRRIKMKGLSERATIISLYQCYDGYIWIGTHSEGLIRLDPHTNEIKKFDTEFGLPGNLIQSIAVDHDHFLWISTNNGISKFVFSQNAVTNYSKEEGLQSGQFNPNSVFVCDDGMMLFGGINGMNAFYPDNIHKSEYAPELVFTGFTYNNQPTDAGQGEQPLRENIIVAREVSLTSGRNSFSVEYAALEYDFSRRTQYMSYLEGFDAGWQNRRTDRKLTYTNLNPGTYQLHVKAINKDGFVSDKVSTLVIKVLPAWHQTKTFLVLMIIFVFGGAYTIVQLRINFFKRQSRKLEEKVTERTLEINQQSNEILAQNEELQAQNDQILKQREELEAARDQLAQMNTHLEELVKNRTKKLEKTIDELDRFVYSASHDLSAPLKSVLGLLNIAKIDMDQSRVQEYLQYIEHSILKLEEVIKSLIAYSRNTRLEVQLQQFNLYDLVDEVIAELAFLPYSKNIKFLKHIEKNCIIHSDRQRLKIVLHNLINNSIKYSDPEKPESFVKVACHHNEKKHVIRIEDNGIGIVEEMQPKIFTMFFRATEKSDGSGLGLFIVKETLAALKGKIKVFSVPGEETTFQISLPQQ